MLNPLAYRIGLLLLAVAASPAWAAQIYDANAAFKANEVNVGTQTNSTFGPFAAGWGNTIPADGGPASPFTTFTAAEFTNAFAGNANTLGFQTLNNAIVPAAAVNALGNTPGSGFAGLNPGEILLHPGGRGPDGFVAPIQNGVLEFTAPTTGSYVIAGDFRSLAPGSTLNEIGVNGAQVFSVVDPGGSPNGTAYPFSFVQALNAGDKVDFAVNQGGDSIGSDSTGLTATLTVVPEPSSWLLLCLGGTAVILLTRRAGRR